MIETKHFSFPYVTIIHSTTIKNCSNQKIQSVKDTENQNESTLFLSMRAH